MTTALSNSKIPIKKTKTLEVRNAKEYSEKMIESIISSGNEAEIESIYNKKEILALKQKILIYRIKKLRNDSALKIQNMWNKYKLRLFVHKLAHKVRGCYSIYPERKDALKMYIKIFNNELKKEEYKILKLDFCQIRKCFIKDINKNKFYTSKKIMYFNFIKNNEIFFDDKYEKVLYLNQYVHKVDFSIYDKRQKILDETIYNMNNKYNKISKSNSKESTYLSTEDEKECSENSTLTPENRKNEKIFRFSSNQVEVFKDNEEEGDDEYNGLRATNRICSNEIIKERKRIKKYRRFESFDSTYSCKSRLKSILKESNCEELHKRKLINIESGKKVSFGETFYSY